MSSEATDIDVDGEEPKKKGLLVPLLIGLVLAGAGGAGGFFAGSSGILGGGSPASATKSSSLDIKTSFIDVEPLTISVQRPDRIAQIRLRLALEVDTGLSADVEKLMPRIKDVLNTYLRAVDPSEFDGSSALVRLRAQMLRRVQIVVGGDAVHDLLVQDFVVN